MARLNLWCEQADDRKQLVHPTASIQSGSVHPLFDCPFILSLSCHLWFIPCSHPSNFHLLRKGKKKQSRSPPDHRRAAVLSVWGRGGEGLLYEVPLSALRASCSLWRYVSYRRITASRCSYSSLSRKRRKFRSSGTVNASH